MTSQSTTRQLRVALVASYDVTDLHAWSGTAYYVLQTLRSCGFEVVTVGALDDVACAFATASSGAFIISAGWNR